MLDSNALPRPRFGWLALFQPAAVLLEVLRQRLGPELAHYSPMIPDVTDDTPRGSA